MPNSRIGGTPDSPDVVGFELPAAELRGTHGVDQVAVAMLDVVPSRDWTATFLQQSDAFKSQHGLTDVRVLGNQITLIGRLGDARTLTASAKLLVEKTSQLRMRERLSHRDGPGDAAPAARAEQLFQDHDPRMRDVATVAAIPEARHVLSELIRLTGMRFAAIARVTDTRWTACATYDLLDFGLKPGQDLVLESTICNEIRQNPGTVAFEQASKHPMFATHHTPALYGFESYISVPIMTPEGEFFGTLCALDPRPAVLGRATIDAVEALARIIGHQLPALRTEEAIQ